jgi:hypothetical protein
MNDLVQRLREMSSDTIGPAAANRIQWLEAERDELSQLVAQANKRIERQAAATRQLRDDLLLIAGTSHVDAVLDPQRAIRVAKAALAATENL